MARRPRGAELEFRREVRLVEDAREFITVGPEHDVWRSDPSPMSVTDGAFVRLEPPEYASDEHVAALRAALLKGGAVRVAVLPRRRRAAVLAPRERRPHRRAREVVLEMVAEVDDGDRAAVAAFAEEVMSRRGL